MNWIQLIVNIRLSLDDREHGLVKMLGNTSDTRWLDEQKIALAEVREFLSWTLTDKNGRLENLVKAYNASKLDAAYTHALGSVEDWK